MHQLGEQITASLTVDDVDSFHGARGLREAEPLWDALARAREHYDPLLLATAEDALFRFYLPLARTVTRERIVGPATDVDADRAAELGLAEAVLRWGPADARGFERYARAVIAAQLRRALAVAGAQRPHQHADRKASRRPFANV